MLSSVQSSDQAFKPNIAIMGAFVEMRRTLNRYEQLKWKMEEMESEYDEKFRVIFKAIQLLLSEDIKPKRRIGF